MLKQLLHLLIVLLSVLIDTAVVPVFYTGRFLLPLSLAVIINYGIHLGRMSGMLFGLIAGILLDITAGTIGMKLFPYILIGYLIGFFLDQQPEISRSLERRQRLAQYLTRAMWIAALLTVYEIVMCVYSYFYTAVFKWSYVSDLLLRVVCMTALSMLLYPLMRRILLGRARTGSSRRTQEVKNF